MGELDWPGLGIGFGINFAVIAMSLAWRARLRGRLLLDAGPLEGPLLSHDVVAYVPLALMLAILWFRSRSAGPELLVMMVMACAGLLVVVVVMKKGVRLRFTDQGVCFLGLIRWGQILSYRWARNPEGGERLELHISMRRGSTWATYAVAAMYREPIAELLAAHVPRGAQGPGTAARRLLNSAPGRG